MGKVQLVVVDLLTTSSNFGSFFKMDLGVHVQTSLKVDRVVKKVYNILAIIDQCESQKVMLPVCKLWNIVCSSNHYNTK